ncbi:MAG: U32 family peptidase C-terminal domain-containing protein [Streptococcus parasanguinis]
MDFDPSTMTATIRQRNVINEGDQVEFYGPGFRHFEYQSSKTCMMPRTE